MQEDRDAMPKQNQHQMFVRTNVNSSQSYNNIGMMPMYVQPPQINTMTP